MEPTPNQQREIIIFPRGRGWEVGQTHLKNVKVFFVLLPHTSKNGHHRCLKQGAGNTLKPFTPFTGANVTLWRAQNVKGQLRTLVFGADPSR